MLDEVSEEENGLRVISLSFEVALVLLTSELGLLFEELDVGFVFFFK